MTDLKEIIRGCKKKNAKAQRALYDIFKSKLMGLCKRYARNIDDAKDILQESFIKIFQYIDKLENQEKLENWIISITIRTAIDHYKKTKKLEAIFDKTKKEELENISDDNAENLTDEFLISIINNLPDGCRLVFNLYLVEGFNHTEIASLLGISEGTSRSQLHYAKHLLKEKLNCDNLKNYYEKEI